MAAEPRRLSIRQQPAASRRRTPVRYHRTIWCLGVMSTTTRVFLVSCVALRTRSRQATNRQTMPRPPAGAWNPPQRRIPLGVTPPHCQPLPFAAYHQALAWCDAEHENLVAAIGMPPRPATTTSAGSSRSP